MFSLPVLHDMCTSAHAFVLGKEGGGRQGCSSMKTALSGWIWSLPWEIKFPGFILPVEFLSHLLYSQQIVWNMTPVSFRLVPCNLGVSVSLIILWWDFLRAVPKGLSAHHVLLPWHRVLSFSDSNWVLKLFPYNCGLEKLLSAPLESEGSCV